MKEINIRQVRDNVVSAIADEWMLITAGDQDGYNTMTASWGMMGELWGDDAVTCYIRPQRYTAEFVRSNDYFTLSFYGEEQKAIHSVCGSKSGRDVNKAELAGLTPDFSEAAPFFKQARLVLVCRKLYSGKIDPEGFNDKEIIDRCYPLSDYHEFFVGKIEKVLVKD